MTLKIEFPKPLPELDVSNLPLETGFTPTEIVALQNGWRLIKRRLNYHSSQIFSKFFRENYLLLDRFRNSVTGKFYISALHQHPLKLMNIYGNLIESGLSDTAYLNGVLCEVSQKHKIYGVTMEDIKLHNAFVHKYLVEFLEKVKSETFVIGLQKLNDLIEERHIDKDEETQITTERKSSDSNNIS